MGIISGGGSGSGGLPSGLTWGITADGQTLGLNDGANGSAVLAAVGLGCQLIIEAADGDATHVGGELTLTSGGSAGQSSGDVTLESGSDGSGGDSGSITIRTGPADSGSGGDIDIRTNPAGGSAVGGSIHIIAGPGQTGSGGSIIIQPGPKVAGGSHGSLQLYSADGNQYVQLDNDGLQVGATKLGFFQGAAVVQPTGVAVTAAGIHAALVSLGLITA